MLDNSISQRLFWGRPGNTRKKGRQMHGSWMWFGIRTGLQFCNWVTLPKSLIWRQKWRITPILRVTPNPFQEPSTFSYSLVHEQSSPPLSSVTVPNSQDSLGNACTLPLNVDVLLGVESSLLVHNFVSSLDSSSGGNKAVETLRSLEPVTHWDLLTANDNFATTLTVILWLHHQKTLFKNHPHENGTRWDSIRGGPQWS